MRSPRSSATTTSWRLRWRAASAPSAPLFPTRQTARPEEAAPAARFDLFEAVGGLLERLAGEQPVVLVLEDLQWATPPTVQLLRHLVRHPAAARVLVLGSYRGDEVGPGHPLHDLLAEVRSVDLVTVVELAALNERDVASLVAGRVPNAPEEGVRAFARRMWEDSAGSPFFVCELLHHLSSTGELERLLQDGGGEELPIPDTVREVVGQRLARLPEQARRILADAAVVGLAFDLDLVAELAGERPDVTLERLEEVARVNLVNEVGSGRFAFAHAIVRGTLLDGLSATRRALGHRRVAETLERVRPADHDELAHHWRLAGDQDRFIVHLERAARRDLEALAYESAADRYQVVLDHHRSHQEGDDATMARAWLGIGLAQRALGHREFIDAIEEAGRLGRRVGDLDVTAAAASASVLRGTFFVTAGQTQTGLVQLCEDALALMDDDDPRRSRVLSTLAAHLTYDDDRARRVELVRQALELARANGDPELIGHALVGEYLALWDPTTFHRRDEIAREVGRMARASGNVELAFFAGFFAAFGAVERSDVATARLRLSTLHDPAKDSRNFYFAFLMDRLLVSLDILTGRRDVQAQVDDLAARFADTHADTIGTWSLQTGALAWQAGTLGSLVPAMRQMAEESALGPNWQAAYGMALLESGDRAAAEQILDEFEDRPLDFFWITTTQGMAELAAGLGRTDVMAGLLERLLPYREQMGVTASGSMVLGLVSTTLGRMALGLGQVDLACDLLQQAVALAEGAGSPWEETRARRLLATALMESGAPDATVEAHLARAIELAAHHRFAGEAELLVTLAEALGPAEEAG